MAEFNGLSIDDLVAIDYYAGIALRDSINRQFAAPNMRLMPRTTRRIDAPELYEARNIADRWIMMLVNTQYKYSIFEHLLTGAPSKIDDKMDAECVEKKFDAESAVRWRRDIAQELTQLLAGGQKAHIETRANPHGKTTTVTFGNRSPLVYSGDRADALMQMRYSIGMNSSQHWGVPRATYDALYDAGIRNEAFASPMNSRMRGKPDARWYSAFPDVDAAFGSSGSFFSKTTTLDPGTTWVCNPPYVEQIMDATATKIYTAIRDAQKAGQVPPLVVLIVPDWRDCDAVDVWKRAPVGICRAQIDLAKHTYFFEAPDNTRVVASFNSVVFILGGAEDVSVAPIKAAINTMRVQAPARRKN